MSFIKKIIGYNMFQTASKIGENELYEFSKNQLISWKDKETGLIWEFKTKNNFEKTYTYKDALNYAEELNRAHYDNSLNWRVPTVDELLTLGTTDLFDYRKKHLNYHTRASWTKKMESFRNGRVFAKNPIASFMNQQVDSWYWSSSSSDNQNMKRGAEKVWVVNFFEGGNYHNGIEQKNSLICVRTK
jgi:hypothetical protein